MKINRIHINHFGKLRDHTLDFEDGFHIIYGNNEDGKSTVMAFIKMMFYGSTGKSSDLSKNIRKRYMPWDGAKMSGSIEFEDKGIHYRVERQFGASNATDKISLWNLATGEKEKIASGADLGQRFFGIGAAAFEKSVFIGQAGSMAGSDKDDEITQKLLNLVSTGDESVSQKKVDSRLQTAKEELKSKSGRIGILDKQYQRLNQLAEERAAALEEEEKKKELERQREELARQKETLEQEYQRDKSLYELQEKLTQLEDLDKLISKKKEIDNQIDELKNQKRDLTAGETVFDTEFVKNGEGQISRVQSLKGIFTERNRIVEALEAEKAAFDSRAVPEIAPESAEQIKAQEKELTAVRQSIASLKESIRSLAEAEKKQTAYIETEKLLSAQTAEKQRLENALNDVQREYEETRQSAQAQRLDCDRKKQELDSNRRQFENAYTEHQVALHNLKSTELLSSQKVEMAKERLKQARTPRQVTVDKNAGREIRIPMLIGAICIVLLSVVLGILVHPACFAGVLPAAILAVLAFGKSKTKSVVTTIIDDAEVEKAEKELADTRAAASQEAEKASQAEKTAADRLQELKAKSEQMQKAVLKAEPLCQAAQEQLSAAERSKNELTIQLKFISEKVSGLAEEVKAKRAELDADAPAQGDGLQSLQEQFSVKAAYETALSNQIKAQLSNMGCGTVDELQNKFMQYQSYQAKVTAKTEELAKAKAGQAQAKENLTVGLQSFIAFVSKYKAVSTYEDAVDAIRDLKSTVEEISAVRVRLESQNEYINEEIQGRTVEELRKEADTLRGQILAVSNGVMPEKLDGQKNAELKQLCSKRFEQLQKTTEAFIQMSSSIKNRFAGKKNVSELETEIGLLKKEISEKESDYDCLDIAQSTLTEAFNEIRQSFGPLLNEKTAAIFNNLTGGKYHNVLISRNFDINVQDAQNAASHEWQYLSSGTVDQAYLSLRLAVAGLLTQEGTKLPLLLDDVFLQYDDDRMRQGLKFLADYANQDAVTQVILFTCHKSILEQAKKDQLKAVVKNI